MSSDPIISDPIKIRADLDAAINKLLRSRSLDRNNLFARGKRFWIKIENPLTDTDPKSKEILQKLLNIVYPYQKAILTLNEIRIFCSRNRGTLIEINVSHPLKQLVNTNTFAKRQEGIFIPEPSNEHVLRNHFSILINEEPFKYVVYKFTPLEWVAGDDVSFGSLIYSPLEPHVVSSVVAIMPDRVMSSSFPRLKETNNELGKIISRMRSTRTIAVEDIDPNRPE